MSRRALGISFAAVVAFAASVGVPRAAVDRIVGVDGVVHRVDVEGWPQGKGPGTALRYTRQTSEGTSASLLLHGTDDMAIDREPSLTLDTATGRPVLVWSRNEGLGFELFAAVYDNGAWGVPRAILAPRPDRVRPAAKGAGDLIHVFWTQRESSGRTTVYRVAFRPGDFSVAFGPEPATLDCASAVSPDGGSVPDSIDPPDTDTYFAAELPGRNAGEPSRLGVWGVRDEPVPIDFRIAFALPGGCRDVQNADAAVVAGRLLVWFEWAGDLWYTLQEGDHWMPMRVLKRDAAGGAADALLLLREMIERQPVPAP